MTLFPIPIFLVGVQKNTKIEVKQAAVEQIKVRCVEFAILFVDGTIYNAVFVNIGGASKHVFQMVVVAHAMNN